jgi:hypothetical protein
MHYDDQYLTSPDMCELSGHKVSIYTSSSPNIQCHERWDSTSAQEINMAEQFYIAEENIAQSRIERNGKFVQWK